MLRYVNAVTFAIVGSLLVQAAPAAADRLDEALGLVRQAEKDAEVRSVKAELKLTRQALRTAESSVRRGDVEEVMSARGWLRHVLEHPRGVSQQVIDKAGEALDLLTSLLSTMGGFRGASSAEPGLQKLSFVTPMGSVIAYMPDDLSAGDMISGTVELRPRGTTEEERERNAAELSSFVLETRGGDRPLATWTAAAGTLRWTVGAGLANDVELHLHDDRGTDLAVADVAVLARPPMGPVASGGGGFQVPAYSQTTKPLEILGVFDGNDETTSLTLGDHAARLLAESPRKAVFDTPLGELGPIDFALTEGDREATGTINVLGVSLRAPITDLDLSLRRETTMTATVEGLRGLGAEHFPVPFWLENHNPETIRIENVESQSSWYYIPYDEVSPDGVYTFTQSLRGVQPGDYNISILIPGWWEPGFEELGVKIDDCSLRHDAIEECWEEKSRLFATNDEQRLVPTGSGDYRELRHAKYFSNGSFQGAKGLWKRRCDATPHIELHLERWFALAGSELAQRHTYTLNVPEGEYRLRLKRRHQDQDDPLCCHRWRAKALIEVGGILTVRGLENEAAQMDVFLPYHAEVRTSEPHLCWQMTDAMIIDKDYELSYPITEGQAEEPMAFGAANVISLIPGASEAAAVVQLAETTLEKLRERPADRNLKSFADRRGEDEAAGIYREDVELVIRIGKGHIKLTLEAGATVDHFSVDVVAAVREAELVDLSRYCHQ